GVRIRGASPARRFLSGAAQAGGGQESSPRGHEEGTRLLACVAAFGGDLSRRTQLRGGGEDSRYPARKESRGRRRAFDPRTPLPRQASADRRDPRVRAGVEDGSTAGAGALSARTRADRRGARGARQGGAASSRDGGTQLRGC